MSELLDCVQQQSTTAKLVYKSLEYDGPFTQSDLARSTGLSRQAIRRAVTALGECGVVEERFSLSDARQKVYRLTETA